MAGLTIFIGIIFLVVGIVGVFAPEGVLDTAGMSEERTWYERSWEDKAPRGSATEYDIDPDLVKAGGIGLAVVGLILVGLGASTMSNRR